MSKARPRTYRDCIPDEEGREALRSVIFHHHHGNDELLVPPCVNVDVVRAFLNDEIPDDAMPEPVRMAANCARFYVLAETLERFTGFLTGQERESHETLRSIEVLRVMGDLGDDAMRDKAAKYFDGLLRGRHLGELMPELIECYFHLPGVDEQVVADVLKKRLGGLKREQPGSPRPNPDYVATEDHLENTLPITTEAKQHKDKVLTEPDAEARAELLARLYTGLEDPAGVEWPEWAAYQLMAELKRGSPKTAIAGLKHVLDEKPPTTDQQYLDYMRARATRAIVFFGGALPESQQDWPATDRVRRFQLQG
jgi:hypothetical protein